MCSLEGGGYGADITPVMVSVDFDTNERLHIKFVDPKNDRWEVPTRCALLALADLPTGILKICNCICRYIPVYAMLASPYLCTLPSWFSEESRTVQVAIELQRFCSLQ